jgi:phosphate:Na+ symporter
LTRAGRAGDPHDRRPDWRMNALLATALPVAMSVVGGLGIFMLGMKYMSEGMQAVAGNSLRRMIAVVTNNRFLAVGTGAMVTMLVQSSSVSTVIVVGLVNAGLMQLHQAIGVIVGANIGTTITGWILVLQIGKYGLPILGVAALAHLFSRRDRTRFIAMAIMGLGMVFFGLELMKDGFAPLKDAPTFVEAFAWFRADTYFGVLKSVLVGCLLTFLVQSSSATLGITIGLAGTGVIPFTTAAALVLGENIGTTITIMLASIGGTVDAKRTAYAHVLFNVIGVFWITLIFQWYIGVVSGLIEGVYGVNPMLVTMGDVGAAEFAAVITAGIALTHSGFNVTNTLVFLPFLPRFARLLERLVPDPAIKEVARLRHLDARFVDSPVLALEQSRGEVLQMGRSVVKMFDWIRTLLFTEPHNEELIQKAFHREEILDNVQREVVTFLTDVLDTNVPHAIAEEGREQFRIAHEFESIADRLASVLKAVIKLREQKLELAEEQKAELTALHDEVAMFCVDVVEAYARRQALDHTTAQGTSAAIARHVKSLRNEQVQRMIDGHVDPVVSLLYTGMLTDYRRIRAHTMNVHEAALGPRVEV